MALFGFFRGKSQDWGQVPATLGMRVNDQGHLEGTWNGAIALRGLHTYETSYYTDDDGYQQESRRYYTLLSAALDPSLLMGLQVNAASMSARAGAAIFGQRDLRVGHPELDRMFTIKATDEELARRVLGGPVATQLLAALRIHSKLSVTDYWVSVEFSDYLRELSSVRSAFEMTGRIAATILEVRRRELAAWEAELRAGWAPVAQAWRMNLDAPRATMHGVVRGAPIVARADASGSTCVTVTLAGQLGCDLSLAPQKDDGFFASLFRGGDILVGDRAFDDAFVIKGKPTDAVRAVLNPLARSKLLSILGRASAIKVEGGKLEVWARWRVLRSEHIDTMLKDTFAAAEALRPPSSQPVSGPYR